MSISIGAGYDLPEEQKKLADTGSSSGAERSAVVDDLNNKLQVSNTARESSFKDVGGSLASWNREGPFLDSLDIEHGIFLRDSIGVIMRMLEGFPRECIF